MSVQHTEPREELLPSTAERGKGIGEMARNRPGNRGWSDRVINIQSSPDRANNFLSSST